MTVLGSRKARKFKVVLIDLDDTLYRVEQIPQLVRQRIGEYMVQHLSIGADQVSAMVTELYLSYGTTMAGLVASGHVINYDHWHEYVHYGAINYDALLQPDLLLREILCSIDLPKYIFTNADRKHAQLCLDRLGISDCFQGQFDFESIMEMAKQRMLVTDESPRVICKPLPKSYQLITEHLGVEPHEVLFLDDSIRNLASAHAYGMFTVMIGRDTPLPGADLAIPTFHHLPRVLPELFDQPGLVKDDHHSEEAPTPLAAITVPAA